MKKVAKLFLVNSIFVTIMVMCFLSVNTFTHANTAEKHDSQSGEILAMFSRHSLERILVCGGECKNGLY